MRIPSGVNATTRPSALRRRLACLGTLLMLSGCGTNVLHNAADFKAATKADEISKKIDYAAVIQVERTVQGKVLEHELSVVNEFATARRDYALLNLMTARKSLSVNLGDRIAARQKVLTGSAMPTLTNVTLADLVPAGAICGPGLAAADPAKKMRPANRFGRVPVRGSWHWTSRWKSASKRSSGTRLIFTKARRVSARRFAPPMGLWRPLRTSRRRNGKGW